MSKAKQNIDDIFDVLKKRKNGDKSSIVPPPPQQSSDSMSQKKSKKNKPTDSNSQTNQPAQSKSSLNEVDGKKVKVVEEEKHKSAKIIDQKKGKSSEKESSSSYGLIKSDAPGGQSWITSPEAPLERIDAETGLPVYKAHLLKVGDGGGIVQIIILII